MAQDVFQVSGVRDDTKHEELQRLQQITVLQCVSNLNVVLKISLGNNNLPKLKCVRTLNYSS